MSAFIREWATDRLLLRELNPGTAEWLWEEAGPSEKMKFFGCHSIADLNLQIRRFRDSLIQNARFSYRHWLLVRRKDGAVIGDAGFHTWYILDARAELGYGFRREEWSGQGLMREAVSKILHLGFGEMSLYRVEAYTSPYNKSSQKLLEHLGFEREGLLRAYFQANGRPNDALCYALLRPAWAQRGL